MTATRVGETFHLDLDGTAVDGPFIEVDPPHRMLLRWDRQGTDTATPTPAFIEITLPSSPLKSYSPRIGADHRSEWPSVRGSSCDRGWMRPDKQSLAEED